MVGMKTEYAPERLFGSTGTQLAAEIRAHNHAQSETIITQLRGDSSSEPTLNYGPELPTVRRPRPL